jgi:myo-inositol-1(or 4)-monophosphatase
MFASREPASAMSTRHTGCVSASPTEEQLLTVAVEAARAAATELGARFRAPAVDVRSKTTATDPVSAADLAAEAAIRAVLARQRPGDAILGEEGGESDGVTGLRWVVDPLDGTVNYLYGIATVAVSVACEDAAGALAGVVLDPLGSDCFTATRSGSALLNGEAIEGSSCKSLDRALVATGFAYDAAVRREQGAIVARLLPKVRDIRRAGSAATDLASAAAGRVDAYFERGVQPWDIAAGALICTRAGLAVRTLAAVAASEGRSALPSGIVVAPPALIDQLEQLVT